MAILSSIKNTLKKIGSAVKSAASKAASNLKANVTANTASAANGLDYSKSKERVASLNIPADPKPSNKQTGVDAGGTKYYNNYTPTNAVGSTVSGFNSLNSSGGVGSKDYGPTLPTAVSADPRTISRSNGNKATSSAEFSDSASALQTAPLRTSALASSASTTGATGSVSGGGYGLPSSGSSVMSAPKIDTTGLAGGMSGLYTYNNKTGQFEAAKDTTAPDNLDAKANDRADLLKQYLGVEPSVYDDKEVRRAMKDRNALRESLQAPTAELNAVLAKQQQDVLQLRATGAQEGVTEAVYGQQANAVNYAAAIRALPLQASIANIQGQIELAQDYISELVTVKTEQIKRKYEYNKQLFNSISGMIDKEDERSYQELKTKNDRDYKDQTDLEKFKGDLMMEAMKNGASDSAISRINNSSDRNAAIQAAGRYIASPDTQLTKLDNGDTVLVNTRNGQIVSNIGGAKPVGKGSQGVLATLPTSIQGKVISIATGFGDKPNIKKYIEAVDSVNIVNGIDPKSKNPADHQQVIYAFAKALDPDSAVKEGEYNTIRKYAQSTLSRYNKEITNAINGTGFLSENAIKNIQTTMKNTLDSRKSVYTNSLNDTKKVINNIAGANVADDIMMDYTEGINSQSTGITSQVNVAPELQSMRSKYNY